MSEAEVRGLAEGETVYAARWWRPEVDVKAWVVTRGGGPDRLPLVLEDGLAANPELSGYKGVTLYTDVARAYGRTPAEALANAAAYLRERLAAVESRREQPCDS